MNYLFRSFITVILLYSGSLLAQSGLQNNGAIINVPNGANLIIESNYTNSTQNNSHGQIQLDGNIYLSGDWTNNALGGDLLSGSLGEVFFNGNTLQKINGSRTTLFSNITLNENVEIETDYEVSGVLDLNDGSVFVGDNDLTLSASATIVNFNENNFIVTDGAGGLKMDLVAGGAEVLFPVGTSASYNPIKLKQNASGNSALFKVKVIEGVYTDGSSGNLLSNTEPCVNKTWLVESNSSSINLDMNLQWDLDDEVNSFDRQNCYISHYTNGAWDQQSRIIANGSGPYNISRQSISSLSPFTIAGDNDGAPLPVELVYFEVHKQNKNALLNWRTSSELNNDYFLIQRSNNAVDWTTIGKKEGQGSTSFSTYYQFTDFEPYSGLNYYRLKQFDYNGKSSISEIREVEFDSDDIYVNVFPNPLTNNILNIVSNTDILNVEVLNAESQLINSYVTAGVLTAKIKLDVSSGIYYLKIKHKHCITMRKLVVP